MSKNIFFSLFISFFSSYIIAQASVDEVTEPADSSGILDELIDQKSDAIIKYAKQFMGVPYVWGGMSPSGFDCSGFINYVFRGFGFSLTRTSYGLAELGTTVSLKDLQPGDLRGDFAQRGGVAPRAQSPRQFSVAANRGALDRSGSRQLFGGVCCGFCAAPGGGAQSAQVPVQLHRLD